MDTKHIHCMLEEMAEYGKCMIEEGAGSGNVNLDYAGKIVDIVKDLACAEKDALIAKEMREYAKEEEEEEKYLLRMLKEEHKDDYKRMREEYGEEEGERRFYDNYRHADGRFARKGTGMYMPRSSGRRRGYVEPPYYHMMPEMYEHDPEYWRDMDRKDGKMYYTETMPHHTGDMSRTGAMHDMKPESRFDKAKRGYTEAKEIHKGSTPEDKQITMREAEKFTNIAIDELMEALDDASPEVKNMVKTKVMSKMQKLA